jgi:D-alanyl-D-alanine carboxypeptidase/D-alanyl-D-alanine-endopeptidase (penicillin-binding protein 4)
VIFTDKVSQNLHAEMLFHQLGHHVLCGKGSSLESARMVRAFLVHAGVEAGDLFLFDGSGLSAHDLTTPRALAQLLRFDATQSWFADLKAALPVGGVDGSLTTRFGPPDSTLKGRVWAKTGTLGESRALSGYVTTAGGQTLIFSILDDNHAPNSSADRVVMDRIVEAIAAQP